MATHKIRVQIADDHDVVVQGLCSILKDEADIDIVAEPIRSGKGLLEEVRRAQPDVLLLDAKMPDFDLLVALDQLSEQLPRVRILVVTAVQDPHLVKAASQRHAAGYVLKEEALSALLPLAVRDVHAGHLWFSPKASQILFDQSLPPAELNLSNYQMDVLRLMVQGKSPEEIAEAMQRSLAGVYNAQHLIREKLTVDTNEQAVVEALKAGLVSLEYDG